jgi:RNA polymerase sigma-70 factor (ECF subfamily)
LDDRAALLFHFSPEPFSVMNDVLDGYDDAQVIREILEGDVNAFATLLERYEGYVCRIVTKHVPRDRIEEVAHETFVRAYRSLKTFKAKTPFQHWLSRIAVRCCYDFWRQHYRNRETTLGSVPEGGQRCIQSLLDDRSAESFAEHARSHEPLRLLRWAMDRLSAEDRVVLTLIHLEEHTVAEAADLLGWSVPSVKTRAFRARRKLRKALSRAIAGV